MCEIGARPSATDKLQQGCSKDKPREPSEYREKPPFLAGKSSGIVTQERHYLTASYAQGERVYDVSRIDLDIFKIGIIIEVSVNGYISVIYIC